MPTSYPNPYPSGKTIHIYGVVQGVGFRPTVWRLAQKFGLIGRVWNEGDNVTIQAWGAPSALTDFIQQLSLQAPPLARVLQITSKLLDMPADIAEFCIVDSEIGATYTQIAADAATCIACLAEINNPANRRYRYAFTNCTHCGPRFSIIHSLPYDRKHTSMAEFEQCPACLSEYENPADRRFHAQPNACPLCGPQLMLVNRQGLSPVSLDNKKDVIAITADLIRQGYIIAVKSLGGFHLACDATNQQAVSELRKRKQRDQKPFAIMVRDTDMLHSLASFTVVEQHLLKQAAAPIVLLAKKDNEMLAIAIAPGQNTLGCMLPYTPLHHSLMQDLNRPMVLTSANRNAEPQCVDNHDAQQRLADIADYWLLHNRQIINGLDDSVVRVIDSQARLLRRARGYAPVSLALPGGFEKAHGIIGMGGELKNTFCLLQDQQGILSPYIGDLENALTHQNYRHKLALYQDLFNFKAQVIAVDRHEGYLSTQYGRQWAAAQSLKIVTVQHHHAHIAACMAEYGLAIDTPALVGVALDGLGLGEDGQLWGGEFFKVDYRQCARLATFQSIPMLGGTQAILQPWRNTYAHLKQYFDWQTVNQQFAELDIMRYLNTQALNVFDRMLEKQINTPLTSSCGRWFDAFAAVLGICLDTCSYEGQAAISLENLAEPMFISQRGFGYAYKSSSENDVLILSWQPFWLGVLNDLLAGVDKAIIAARVHHGLAQAIAQTALQLCTQVNSDIVILSGGVFQNRLLLEEVSQLLRLANKLPLSPAKLPCNDGGLALGQAVIAAARQESLC